MLGRLQIPTKPPLSGVKWFLSFRRELSIGLVPWTTAPPLTSLQCVSAIFLSQRKHMKVKIIGDLMLFKFKAHLNSTSSPCPSKSIQKQKEKCGGSEMDRLAQSHTEGGRPQEKVQVRLTSSCPRHQNAHSPPQQHPAP